jgi:hypothetical protein
MVPVKVCLPGGAASATTAVRINNSSVRAT